MIPSTLKGSDAIWNCVEESKFPLIEAVRNFCKQQEINFCVWRGASQTYRGAGISRGYPAVGSRWNMTGKNTLFYFVTRGGGKMIVEGADHQVIGIVTIGGGMAEQLFGLVESLVIECIAA